MKYIFLVKNFINTFFMNQKEFEMVLLEGCQKQISKCKERFLMSKVLKKNCIKKCFTTRENETF